MEYFFVVVRKQFITTRFISDIRGVIDRQIGWISRGEMGTVVKV